MNTNTCSFKFSDYFVTYFIATSIILSVLFVTFLSCIFGRVKNENLVIDFALSLIFLFFAVVTFFPVIIWSSYRYLRCSKKQIAPLG